MEMRRVEREFYRFGGEANLSQLKADMRVPGVDKRLMLIEPTEKGMWKAASSARKKPRLKFWAFPRKQFWTEFTRLLKRDTVGRTGVFIKREVAPDETFELALKKLAELNPAVRRRMKK